MAGDLHNAVGRLRAQLKRIRYPHVPAAIEDLARNDTLLRILHFTFLDYSRHLAQFVSSKGYDLYGATDARFVASLFRLLRDEFRLFPSLTSAQFLSNHHTERKLTLVADAIMMAQKQHGELVRSQRREEAKWTNPKRSPSDKVRIQCHVVPPADAHIGSILSQFQEHEPKASHPGRHHMKTAAPRQHIYDNAIPQTTEDEHVDDDYVHNPTSPSIFVSDNTSPPTKKPQLNHSHTIISSHQCQCADRSNEAVAKIEALSSQLRDMSSKFMKVLSDIDSRLEKVEEQMGNLLKQQLSATASRSPQRASDYAMRSQTPESTLEPSQRSLSDRLPKLSPHLDGYSWPPEPPASHRH